MATRRIDFIAYTYIDEDAIAPGMPVSVALAHMLSVHVPVHVRDSEFDSCDCCSYSDCGKRRIPRD